MNHATLLSCSAVFAVFAIAMVGPGVAFASGSTVDAAHQIVVDGEQLRVTSRWYGHLPRDAWEFAVPLPPGTRVLDPNATLTLDPDGRSVVAITYAEPPSYPLVLELEIPWTDDDSILAVPLPPEPGWQRVEVEGDYRLIPEAGAALPLHTTGYYAPGDLRVQDRLRIDRGLDRRHPAGAAYLPGAMLREAGGVPARLESGARRKLGLGVAAGGAFVSGLLVLTVVFRRSAATVEVEDAEAYLESELRDLSDLDSDSDSSQTP